MDMMDMCCFFFSDGMSLDELKNGRSEFPEHFPMESSV